MPPRARFLIVAGLMMLPAALVAQTQADVAAVHQLLERYRTTEDSFDLAAQARLMTNDRVWLSSFARGRRTDNVANMRIQQAQAERTKKLVPKLQQINEDRELLVKFYGGGAVAIASFFRYTNRLFPVGTPAEVRAELEPTDELMTVVMEKLGNEWKIVHTHVSGIGR